MLPLGVSMLWEPVEAGAALRERFGFGGLAEVSAWLAEVLRGTWAITAEDADRLVISDQNAVVWVASDRGPLVVKWSRAPERFARLDVSAELLGVLAGRGVPVAAPVPSVDGRARVVLDGPHGPLSVTVLPELAGDWLDVTDLAAVRSAGACLARLHEALRDQTGTRLAQDPAVEGLRSRVERWSATGDRGLAPDASRRLGDALAGLTEPHEAPQLVHNDFRAANLLVLHSEVVAVLDFDEMVVDHPVVDLAHSAVYLATRFTGWGPTPLPARKAFRAGYESVRPLGPVEARWYEVLVLWQSIAAVPVGEDPTGWAGAV
ncbi:phosphotransferase enzyme family protein [Auraticoccus monumenti]|uniref:Ser/Thr protein kinase RdoA involved in Cpx stress response, MazF antagonist n=1 Tax=Auraticoccus monumenti TaxID=675864 RepID=A0A1G6RYL2_9ACTN|nr:phosphotransferase [Auraticoccus monumenti]SDD09035.1 Ser/Thr protein kinase RdoA involved in Cpx stress response, MazF antagonist [Auraticoccus monumenti]